MSPEEQRAALAAPFPQHELRCRPGGASGQKAMVIWYIDARAVMNRLDEVFGLGGWQTSFRDAPGGAVCTLNVKINGEWIAHEDFGGPSAQPKDGDKIKASYSDALKRAAVHLGVGRYLYRLPSQWHEYDPQKKRFVTPPVFPTQGAARNGQPAKAAQPANPTPQQRQQAMPAAQTPPLAPRRTAAQQFLDWVQIWEDKLVKLGVCKPGVLYRDTVNTLGIKEDQPLPQKIEDLERAVADCVAVLYLEGIGGELERIGGTWEEVLANDGLDRNDPTTYDVRSASAVFRKLAAIPTPAQQAEEAVERFE